MFPQFGPGARAEEQRACLARRTQHKGTLPTTRSTTQPDRRGAAWAAGLWRVAPRGPAEEAEPRGATWSGDSDDVPKATAAPRGHGRTRAPGLDTLGCGATCLRPGCKPEAPAHQGGPVRGRWMCWAATPPTWSARTCLHSRHGPRDPQQGNSLVRTIGAGGARMEKQVTKAEVKLGTVPVRSGNSCTQVTCPPSARHPLQPQQAGCDPQIRPKTTSFPVASKDLGSESAG